MNRQLFSDIALFIEVVNAKSFTKAALYLNMPASTLSRRISTLEANIGFRLLNRTTRQLAMTAEGTAYFQRCAELIADLHLAHEALAETITQAKGLLRLSCTTDFATLYLAPLLIEYEKLCPAVKVELLLSAKAEDLVADHLDLAIRIGKLPDSSLVTRALGQLPQDLYASPSYLSRIKTPTAPEDLAYVECIRLMSHEAHSIWTLQHKQDQSIQAIKVEGKYIAGTPSMAQQLAKLGCGIGLLDVKAVTADLKQGTLVKVLPNWAPINVPVQILMPSRLLPARVRIFVDLITQYFKSTVANG